MKISISTTILTAITKTQDHFQDAIELGIPDMIQSKMLLSDKINTIIELKSTMKVGPITIQPPIDGTVDINVEDGFIIDYIETSMVAMLPIVSPAISLILACKASNSKMDKMIKKYF